MSMVYVVDGDGSECTRIARLLRAAEFNVETFGGAAEFRRRERYDGIRCAVVNVKLPDCQGLELRSELSASAENMPLILIADPGDFRECVRAIKAGATDYLTRPFSNDDLLKSIHEALDACAHEVKRREKHAEVDQRLAQLSAREMQVLGLVLTGRLNKQIAAELGITERTVKEHRGQMLRKLRVHCIPDLVRLVQLSSGLDALQRKAATRPTEGSKQARTRTCT